MSQDIRSFFSRTPKGKESKSKIPEPEPDKKKKNRKRVVLDSDSDDEPVAKSKPNGKQKSPKQKVSSPKKSKLKDTVKGDSAKSKYFEVPKNDVLKMFGTTPIKRVEHPKKEPKKEVINEFNDDEDFVAAVSQLNEEDEDIFISTPVIKTKTVEKTDPEKSPSNGLKSPGSSKLSTDKKEDSPKKSPLKQTKLFESCDSKKRKPSLSPLPERESKVDTEERNNEVSKSKKKIKLESPVKEKEGSQPKSRAKVKTPPPVTLVERKAKKKVEKIAEPAPVVKPVENSIKYELWVDKYKPTTLKQIIGQQGDKSNVNKLVKWLRDWYKNHSGDKKLAKPSPWAKDDSGAYFKAALLSGPPGVGKTTTSHLVCKELNMDVVEFNASDTRSKKLLGQEVSELLSSKSLSQFVHGGGEVSKQHVLVMDEVDGMAGNEDRGGVQELINLIKSAKVPVICMCNDRNHPKIRSLANYCFDLRFHKPRVEQIKGAMMSICFREKLKIKPETLSEIVSSTNQDIRLVLNHLSMLAAKGDGDLENATKHVKLGPWDVVKKVFSQEDHKAMSIYDKSDLFFHDYSVAPLFVHENYLLVVPHSEKAKSKRGKMELFAKAASSLCNGDLIERTVRSNNAWVLLPVQAVFSSLVPGEVLEGHMGGMINFPSWFGKNSRGNKLDRLSQEIQLHTRLSTSGGKETIRLDYAKPLRDGVLGPLLKEGTDGIQTSLSLMHDYNLLREDIESLTELTAWPQTKDPMSSVESKVKAAFTRAYNKAPVMSPFSMSAPVKKGKGGGGAATNSEEWEAEPDEEEEQDEEKDDLASDAMIMTKKKVERKKADPAEAGTSKPKKGGGGKKGKK